MTLYKFVRIPDLIVDDSSITSVAARYKLKALRSDRQKAYTSNDIQNSLRWESVKLFYENSIPFVCSEFFFSAMLQDTEKSSYDTYKELQHYMLWSAMVVGEMMCCVLWVYDKTTIHYAHKLWEAMQLTNFLRDVKEDWLEFGRIYMPLEDLHTFSLSPRHIKEFCSTWIINENREKFMAYQIQRADWLYQEALEWLDRLPKSSRKAIYLSAKLYQQILRKIEYLHYNVFANSAKTKKRDKLLVLLKEIR